MAGSYTERLSKLHTKTSENWWPFSFGYPLARRFVAIVGDIRWITPNGLTGVSTLCLMLGAVLLMLRDARADWAALAILQVHVVLDCADGTLARYRGESTALGAFLDKAGDQAGFLLLGASAGYRAFYEDGIGSGQPWIVVAGAVGAGCYVAVCYIYWVAAYFELEARSDKTERSVVPGKEEHASEQQGLFHRLSQLVLGQWRIVHFNAPDFPMWVPVLIIVGYPDIGALAILVTQGATLARKIIERGMAMAALDRAKTQRAEAEPEQAEPAQAHGEQA